MAVVVVQVLVCWKSACNPDRSDPVLRAWMSSPLRNVDYFLRIHLTCVSGKTGIDVKQQRSIFVCQTRDPQGFGRFHHVSPNVFGDENGPEWPFVPLLLENCVEGLQDWNLGSRRESLDQLCVRFLFGSRAMKWMPNTIDPEANKKTICNLYLGIIKWISTNKDMFCEIWWRNRSGNY